MSRPLLAEKQQRLSLRSTGASMLVHADAARLVQVFGNLLNNAAKYSEPGSAIEIGLSVEDGEAVIKVRDQGVGMAPDLLERAFDLFVQDVRSLDRAQGGIGIGLTMVRDLVKLHGGLVQALSEGPGRGCEIRRPPPGCGRGQRRGARRAGGGARARSPQRARATPAARPGGRR